MARAENPYRPPEITDLQRRVAIATKGAEAEAVRTGAINEEVIQTIVDMKFQLDALCGEYLETGKISGSSKIIVVHA
jgi:hypothetical protein